MSTSLKANIKQAKSIIIKYLKAGLVPMMTGSPGLGKSDVIREIAKEFNLCLIDVRLSQADPTDVNGFPFINKNGRAAYTPFDTFPIEGDEVPEGYSGWLIFFDEFNSAPVNVQAASYKIILDRMIGQNKLHKNVAMICAGNEETDNAIVNPLSTAMQSRLVHIELVFNCDLFLDWAREHGFDTRIITYLSWKPSMGNTFSPDHTDKTFACPRTWEFANRLIGDIDLKHSDAILTLGGAITQNVARDFIIYCDIHHTLPKIPDIVNNPETTPVPNEPGSMWAITGAIADNTKPANIDPIITYMSRFPKEFQIVCAKQINQRDPNLTTEPAFNKWLLKTALAVF